VDTAEKNPSAAHDVNHHAVKNLSALCRKLDIFLVHYSTDYVFDGKKGDFYGEQDRTNPLNEYGDSKLKGEEAVRANPDSFLILRLSWVFGKGESNFLCKLAKWAKEKRILKISADEVSIPTYTEDIVEITLAALRKGMRGLYHLTNSGYCSRYELAKYFIKKMGMNNVLIPTPVSAFQTTAKRPLFSAMANDRISKELNVTIPEWENGVDRFIKRFREELP
jgi:dTDP-4-dehydrorhamnose reductase